MDNNNEQIKGGSLIGRGSFGCVFKPSLKCPGEKSSKDDIVSKVFFSEDSDKEAKEEIKIDDMINKIKGNEKWAHIWYKNCKPPPYDTLYKQDEEIEDCLYENEVSEHDFNKYRRMLQGTYAGVSLLDSMVKDFKSYTFTDKAKFTTTFLKYMKLMKPLFIGLKEMYHKGIGHNDIKDENIMIDDEGCKYIDFGLSCEFKDRKFYKKRGESEFVHDRIYPPYPYEYIYLYATEDILKEELDDKKRKIYRSLHDRYIMIHEQIFNRKTHEPLIHLISKFIKDGKGILKKDGKDITSLIDTYSLGMLIPSILCKLAKKHGKMKQLKRCVHISKVSSFIDLFKHMTEPEHFHRMDPDKAYHKYLELDTLYLSKSKNNNRTQRNRRKNKFYLKDIDVK